jgi:TonB family protein
MRCRLINLAVALSTFGLGVIAATIWLASGAPRATEHALADSHSHPPRVVAVPAPPAPPAGPFVISLSECEVESGDADGANADGRSVRQPVRGGILNGRAVSKPVPAYPAEARAARVSGAVAVEVTVDECGQVFEAHAVSGPDALRMAAVDAALGARFTPTLLSGRPVRVSGTILYNFVLQ